MWNKKYLLSICIPTYNREKHLEILLDSIVNQKIFSDKIEIYIYDDPSTDNTQIMVQKYMKKYGNIHYHRNTTRLGMMPSILDSILHCSWEYIWLFGSDDIMWPFSISAILSLIEKENPDLILSNFWRRAEHVDYTNDRLVYRMYNDIEKFCNNFSKQKAEYSHPIATDLYNSYFSYMSIYCFRSDVFKKMYDIALIENGENYLSKHYFNYIYILLWNNKVKNICLCSSPILTYNKSWGTNGRKFEFKIVKDAKSIFNIISKYNNTSHETKRFFRKIIRLWYWWYIGSKISNYYLISFLKKKCSPVYTKLYNLYILFLEKIC